MRTIVDPRRARRGLTAVSAATLLVAVAACDQVREASPPTEPASKMPAFVPATPPLSVGDKLPPLTAEGWVNGPPPSPSAPGVRLLVVDLWGIWCPLCRQCEPDLLGLFKKYAGRGVAFVSLTDMPEQTVASVVKEFSVAWPNGYGAPPETIAALGAGSGMSMPGYAVAPALYLVGPDGRIVWSDGRARYRHVEPAQWRLDVDAAIEAALAKEPAPAR